MLTAEQQARLNYLDSVLGPSPAVPAPQGGNLFARAGEQAVNLPQNIGEGLSNSAIGIFNVTQPADDQIARANFWKPFDIAPPKTFGERAVDVGAGVAQVVAEAALPGGLAAKGARLLGASEAMAPIIGDVFAGGLQGFKQSPGEAAGTGAEFGAIGAANRFIPNPFLKAAANLAIPVGGQLLRGQNPLDQQSLINTGANILVPALLGQYARRMSGPDGRSLLRSDSGDSLAPPVAPHDPFFMPEGMDPSTGQLQRNVGQAESPLPAEQPAASLMRPADAPERASADLSNPAFQYAGGAAVGALAGPLINRDEDTPVWQKMLEGAGIGLGAVGATRGGGKLLLHRTPEPVATSVDDAVNMWKTRSNATIRVLDNESQLPPDWKGQIQATLDMGGKHEAMVNPGSGEVYIFKDNLTDPKRAQQVLAHEVVGHYGVEQILSKSDWNGIRDSIVKPGNPVVENISQQYFGTDVASLNPSQKLRAAREYVARLAENTPLNPNLWERVKGAVNRGLREFGAGGEWNDSEIKGLIQRGNREVSTATEAASARPLLAQGEQPQVEASLFGKRGEEAAREQERGNRTFLGAIERFGEREFNIGKPANVILGQEMGRGEANKLRLAQREPVRLLKSATPADQAAARTFFQSKRTPQDVTILRSTATPEAAAAAEALHAVKRTGQQLQFEATDNPTRQQMLQTTPDYQATSYAAFENQPEWQKTLKANPALRDNFVNHIMANVLPGFERFEAEQAVDSYKAGILRGQDFSGGTGNAARISQYLYTHRKKLSPEVKEYLGEYTDPIQKEVFTVHKLINSAAQAKTISSLADMGVRGELPIMTDAERRSQWQAAKTAGDTAKMESLAALEKMPDAPSFGKLANKLVPRSVIDAMDAHGDSWKGGWSRGMSGATSWLKQALTVDNPATHARQWLQTPLVAMVARVAPWDFLPAAREMRANSAMHTELLEQHMIGADVSSQDIQRGALEMDNGFNPTRLGRTTGALRAVQKWMQKAYGMPDQLVRVAAYIKHKPRFFAEGNAKGLQGAELERYARNETTKWVNEHTMNYGTVPNFVKVARNTPFVSPFISYQAEMLKLLGTMGREAIHGSASDRAWALSNLGMLVAAPLLIAQAARGQLSEKDRAEWDRVQRLSPAYSGSQIRVPLGRNADGSFRFLNIANLAPAGDTAALARNLLNGDGEKLFAGNQFIGWEKTPVLSMAAEQIAGRDLMTDRKFQGPADRATALLKNAVPPWVPPGYEGKRIIQSLTPNAQGGLGTINARTGQEATPGLELLRMGGLPFSQVQPQALLRRAKTDEADQEAQIQSERRQILQTNATDAAKQAATRKALLKIQDAREEYRRLIR